MSQLNQEMRHLFKAASRYLKGESSVHELNGLAGSCIEIARREQASPKIFEVLEEFRRMVNRRWNEWGHERDPLSELEFREWLRQQLPFSE